nr:hypothetical protein [uncultured Rhodopila sp.]
MIAGGVGLRWHVLAVPRTHAGSGFTQRFKALVMTMVSAMPLAGKGRIASERNPRLCPMIQRHVGRVHERADARWPRAASTLRRSAGPASRPRPSSSAWPGAGVRWDALAFYKCHGFGIVNEAADQARRIEQTGQHLLRDARCVRLRNRDNVPDQQREALDCLRRGV